jgi:hypothetical protein
MESLRLIFATRINGFRFDAPPLIVTGERGSPLTAKQSGSGSVVHEFGGGLGFPLSVVCIRHCVPSSVLLRTDGLPVFGSTFTVSPQLNVNAVLAQAMLSW